MYKFLITSLLVAVSSCKSDEGRETELVNITNFNVIIAPDLSNRINPVIHPKPVHDTIIINSIYDDIPKFIKSGGRTTQQKDVFTLDFINTGILNDLNFNQNSVKIDFGQFEKRQTDRSDYIRSKLKNDIIIAKKNVKAIYENSVKNPHGSDIYNYLNSTINNILVSEEVSIHKVSEYIEAEVSTKNILILITDGYIENSTTGSGYQFTESTIQKIRKDFINKKQKDLNAFIAENSQFQINPLTNKSLSECKIIVVEMIDRSLDSNGVAKQYPTDFDIMRSVWEQWFEQSNISDFQFVKAQNTPEQVLSQITKFIAKRPSNKKD